MEKRKFRAIAVMGFAVALVTSVMVGGTTQSEELALLQDSMRELRRTNNLEFSYTNKISSEGMVKSEKVVVWVDQLSGSWVSEHYETDEDGTRLYLKQFCDGTHLYHYDDWSGEWELRDSEDTEVPYLSNVWYLPYGNADIMNVKLKEKGKVLELSYDFTQEYIDSQNQKRQETLEQQYASYQRMQTSDDGEERVQLAVEQYRQTREEDTSVVYRIDSAGVMRGLICKMSLVQPEVVYDVNGKQMLGEDRENLYEVVIEIERYNQDGIVYKIAQCQAETAYYQD